MITGHLGLALGARAVDPEAPLAWLVAATLAPDILDIAIASTGICNPNGAYTHSIASILATALVLGAASAWQTQRGRTGLIVGALVVSHLLADYVTGLKALWVGGPVVGLNLYRFPWADLLIEVPIVVAGWWAARRWGRLPRWVTSRAVLVGLIVLQAAFDLRPHANSVERPADCAKQDVIKGLDRIL